MFARRVRGQVTGSNHVEGRAGVFDVERHRAVPHLFGARYAVHVDQDVTTRSCAALSTNCTCAALTGSEPQGRSCAYTFPLRRGNAPRHAAGRRTHTSFHALASERSSMVRSTAKMFMKSRACDTRPAADTESPRSSDPKIEAGDGDWDSCGVQCWHRPGPDDHVVLPVPGALSCFHEVPGRVV